MLIASRGAKVWELPVYSLDLDTIEKIILEVVFEVEIIDTSFNFYSDAKGGALTAQVQHSREIARGRGGVVASRKFLFLKQYSLGVQQFYCEIGRFLLF